LRGGVEFGADGGGRRKRADARSIYPRQNLYFALLRAVAGSKSDSCASLAAGFYVLA
jgi:hypothetical protein